MDILNIIATARFVVNCNIHKTPFKIEFLNNTIKLRI